MDCETESKFGKCRKPEAGTGDISSLSHVAEEVRSCLQSSRLKEVGIRARGEEYRPKACRQAQLGAHLSRDLGFLFLNAFTHFLELQSDIYLTLQLNCTENAK